MIEVKVHPVRGREGVREGDFALWVCSTSLPASLGDIVMIIDYYYHNKLLRRVFPRLSSSSSSSEFCCVCDSIFVKYLCFACERIEIFPSH